MPASPPTPPDAPRPQPAVSLRVERVHSLFDPPATNPRDDWPAWRRNVNNVIFRADTKLGSVFDWVLLVLIAASVGVVLLESVAPIRAEWGDTLRVVEWSLTAVFTLEYVLRLATSARALGYATSFFGVVDLLSVLPTWLSLFVAGTHVLAVVRVLRMLRIFRLMQLSQFVGEAEALAAALAASASRIIVFMGAVLTIVVIMGSVMYLVEGAEAGFDSIPRAIYWAIVTLTTVGYGDIAPKTAIGQGLAAAVMVLGYAIIAVPTGIVSVEIARESGVFDTTPPAPAEGSTPRAAPAVAPPASPAPPPSDAPCAGCGARTHQADARFCRVCGAPLSASE